LIILGSLVTCITWALYEKGGSVDRGLAKGIIVAMFFVGAGYAGPANTFMATVRTVAIFHPRFAKVLQYPAEIMPTAIRPVGVATAYMAQHILIIILVQFTPQAIETISWKFFLIFVSASVVSIVAFITFYPETRNKTLEELAAVFGDEVREYCLLNTDDVLIYMSGCGDAGRGWRACGQGRHSREGGHDAPQCACLRTWQMNS
jgi:hypothetical protein